MPGNCGHCENIVTDGAYCNACKTTLHFGCAGVQESTYRRYNGEKKEAWRCPDCRSKKPLQAPQPPAVAAEENITLATLCNEIRSSSSQITHKINIVQSDVAAIKADLGTLNKRLDSFDERLTKLEELPTAVETLSNRICTLETEISDLKMQSKIRNQLSRINNVEISGIPTRKGENLNSLFQDIVVKLGVKLSVDDIDSIHRVRRYNNNQRSSAQSQAITSNEENSDTKPQNIIVHFVRRRAKDDFLAAARARRGLFTSDLGFDGPANNIYFGDHLSPEYKLLYKNVRQIGAANHYKFIWIRDCKIFVRKSEKSRVILITSENDLKKMI